MKIAIDIGHTNGTGATGNGLQEHEVATKIAKALQVDLAAMKHTVDIIDFPTMGNDAELRKVAQTTNSRDYDILLSIHCDCSDNAAARGAHATYVSSAGKQLATCIDRHLGELMPGRAEGVVLRTGLYILKHTRAIASLIECGFLSNYDDARKLDKDADAIADAIADGVRDFAEIYKLS